MSPRTRLMASPAPGHGIGRTVRWLLHQEARALLTRLAGVKPFALQETMLPAAAITPAALVGIESVLLTERTKLLNRVHGFIRWLDGPGSTAPPDQLQRRFTLVRLNFNTVLSQFDLFSDVITQRSEQQTGVWLSGLDVFCADALSLQGAYFDAPNVICYLDRGPGAAIRRARTRLPGGAENPVAIVRVPRERMVGHGIASSVTHEVGHQAAALLDLVASLRPVIQARQRAAPPSESAAWGFWDRWISEIVADLWSVGKLGISSTLGLVGVVSLPSYFVFALHPEDPHPMPYLRVRLSCAIGRALYPHRQWRELARMWSALYPPTGLDESRRRVIEAMEATMPEFVALLVDHRPRSLRGRSLREIMPLAERRPERLIALDREWGQRLDRMRDQPPTLVFAVLGQARTRGSVSPESESELVGKLLTYWALRSTLELAGASAPSRVLPPALTPVPNGRPHRAAPMPVSV